MKWATPDGAWSVELAWLSHMPRASRCHDAGAGSDKPPQAGAWLIIRYYGKTWATVASEVEAEQIVGPAWADLVEK